MKFLSIFLFVITFAISAIAQDIIYKKGGEIIKASISEVGVGEVKYKVFNDTTGPVYTIEKDRLIKIEYQNGRVETFQSALKDPELYSDQPKKAIKINFLAPLLGYTQLNYEHNLRPGRSFELSLGIIGLGKRQESTSFSSNTTTYYRDAKGLFVSGGYKLAKSADYTNANAKYSNLFQGFYIKPELSFGTYGQNISINKGGVFKTDRQNVVFSGLIINAGKQWVFSDIFLIDAYAGLGYAIDNVNSQNSQNSDYYDDNFVGNHFILMAAGNSGLGLSGGIKLGILLK